MILNPILVISKMLLIWWHWSYELHWTHGLRWLKRVLVVWYESVRIPAWPTFLCSWPGFGQVKEYPGPGPARVDIFFYKCLGPPETFQAQARPFRQLRLAGPGFLLLFGGKSDAKTKHYMFRLHGSGIWDSINWDSSAQSSQGPAQARASPAHEHP